MKIIYTIIILLAIGIGYLIQIDSMPGKTVAITLITDRTDEQLNLEPEIERIVQLFDLNISREDKIVNGVTIRSLSFSNVDYSQVDEFSLPKVNYNDINRMMRIDEINAFVDSFKRSIAIAKRKESMHSSIYLPFVRESNRLAKTNAGSKYLIVYTDLQDNNEVFNAYKNYNQDADKIITQLEKHAVLERMDSVNVIVRYIPKNEQDNIRFRKMGAVYKRLVENKGGQLFFEF